MSRCRVCGEENPDGNRFCGSCGSELQPEEAGLREERKVVTVVFADLVGFTSRTEKLDPEDVQRLLSPYHARLRSELERFGGTVEKFIGDAVVAVFGAPVAHEDDPERAVRAAIEIRDWIAGGDEDLQVRIGVNSGEALVRLGARPAAGEGMVAGDVVNTAARLQTAASVNGILVGERTRRATDDCIAYRELDPVEVKGKAEPVAVWEAVEPIRRLGVDVPSHARTPLMGRVREMEVLTSTLARVREEHSSQLVTVVGVPGIGKSRLVYELSRVADADPDLITWRQGRCLPYGEGVSYWALAEMVKAQAGIRENDPPQEVDEKLCAATSSLIADETERAWVEVQIRPLVGATADGEASPSQAEAAAGWLRFLEAIGEQGPAILVFEDLHWANEGLLDFVDELADRAAGIPLFVLCTARPELLQRRPAWGGGKANAVAISLPALGEDETARLLEMLLGDQRMDPALRAELLSRAGGNPLYAEQYACSIAEGTELSEPPESVQGIVAARVDALPPAEKELLLDAAVIGKVFWQGAAQALGSANGGTAETLRALERKDFVQRARASSVEGETEYAFRHVLLRDVAYGERARRVRAEKHLRAAGWLESLGRPHDLAEMLAHHYSSALSLSRATGDADPDLERRTGQALGAAGDRAHSLGAFSAAAMLLGEALDLVPSDDPERARFLLRRGRALVMGEASEAGIELLLEAIDACREQGDVDGAAEAASVAGRFYWYQGDRRRSDEYLELALELVAGRPASRAKVEALIQKGSSQMMAGEFADAIATGEEALGLAAKVGIAESSRGGRIRVFIGSSRCCLGDPGGLTLMEEAIELGRAVGAIDVVILGLNNLSSSYFHLRADVGLARTLREEYWELAKRSGFGRLAVAGEAELYGHAFADGRWDEALAGANQWIAKVDEGIIDYTDPTMLGLRATIRLMRGDPQGAAADSCRAVELARRSDIQAQSQTYPVRARVAIEAGELDEARALALEVRALADRLMPALNFPWPTLADVAWVFVDLGMEDELRGLLDDIPFETPWVDAAEAVLTGEPLRAAEMLEGFGHKAAADYCRQRAGVSDAAHTPSS